MKAYKLTNSAGETLNNTLWGENVSHTATGPGTYLCSDGFIHFYTNPLIAVLMNPIHGAYTNPILWECETSGEHIHEPLKSGCKTLTTVKQIPLPDVSITQRVAFAILCAKEVCEDKGWNEWADRWLDGTDRNVDIVNAGNAAYYDTRAAYFAASIAAVSAAFFASVAGVAHSVAVGTNVAVAALYSSDISTEIDFVSLAEKALTYK